MWLFNILFLWLFLNLKYMLVKNELLNIDREEIMRKISESFILFFKICYKM